jgi:hypothetical protein
MADRRADIERIVAEGQAQGLSPTRIRRLIARYDEVSPVAGLPSPLPPAATAGMMAQSTEAGDPAAGPTSPREEPFASRAWDTLQDVGGGLRSSAARTVYGGGDLLRRGLGMERIIETPEVQAAMTPPESTAGRLASAGGDIAQFLSPASVGKYKTALEMVKAGSIGAAQSGDLTTGGATAALTGVIPGVAAVRRGVSALRRGAERTMAQALDPTTRPLKAQAAQLAPQMVARGTRGSREAMLEAAEENVGVVGQKIQDLYEVAGKAGETVDGNLVRQAVREAADGYRIAVASGERLVIPGAEALVARLNALDEFIGKLGPNVNMADAGRLKSTWDDISDSAGLFGSSLAAPTEKAAARAFKKASDSFRQLLNNKNTTLAELNREFSFNKGLMDVLTATVGRKQSQTGGLIPAMMGTAGAAGGFATGEGALDKFEKAAIWGVAGRQFLKVFTSPRWRTSVTARLKDRLARALASGENGRVVGAMQAIVKSLPADISLTIRGRASSDTPQNGATPRRDALSRTSLWP